LNSALQLRLIQWRDWLALAILSIASGLSVGGTLTSLGVYMPALESAEGWSQTALGSAGTSLLFSMSVSSILVGIAIERCGERIIISATVLIAAVGCFLAAHAASADYFIGALAVVGFGVGGTIVPSTVMITRLFGQRRGVALAVFFGTLTLGSAILPPLAGILLTAHGWRTTLNLTGGAIAACIGAIAIMRTPKSAAADGGALEKREHSGSLPGLNVSEALCNTNFWLIAVAITLSQLSLNGVLLAVIAYLVDGGFMLSKAVSIYGLANFIGIPVLFLVGFLADSFGPRKVLPYALFMQALGTVMLIIVFQPASIGWISIVSFILLWGGATGVPAQIAPMLIADTVGPRHFAILLGINTAITGLIGAFAPMETSWLHEISGGYKLAFLVYGVSAALAAPMIFIVRSYFGRRPVLA
jgi:MFS family permease